MRTGGLEAAILYIKKKETKTVVIAVVRLIVLAGSSRAAHAVHKFPAGTRLEDCTTASSMPSLRQRQSRKVQRPDYLRTSTEIQRGHCAKAPLPPPLTPPPGRKTLGVWLWSFSHSAAMSVTSFSCSQGDLVEPLAFPPDIFRALSDAEATGLSNYSLAVCQCRAVVPPRTFLEAHGPRASTTRRSNVT
jgi:hypothetical protein